MRACAWALFAIAIAGATPAAASNPLTAIGETFSDWKDRLFGKPQRIVDAPDEGAVTLDPGHAVRVRIDEKAGQRTFPKGESRFRVITLPAKMAHAAVRVQVIALPRKGAFGNEVFKPFLYTFNEDGSVRDTIEVKPLHLDIRPFRRTRLLGCAMVENVESLAVATAADVAGKSYESEVREAVKAPTQGGFHYATDAVKVKLPWAATGEVVLDVSAQAAAGKGC